LSSARRPAAEGTTGLIEQAAIPSAGPFSSGEHAWMIGIYLKVGDTLETTQAMAAHASPCTNLYDRTGEEIALDEIEKIII
jgi:hypothetical protein